MESLVLLPCTKGPATSLYAQLGECSPTFLKISLNKTPVCASVLWVVACF